MSALKGQPAASAPSVLLSWVQMHREELRTGYRTVIVTFSAQCAADEQRCASCKQRLLKVNAAREKGKPYTIVFVGVNGVGKSTNLAKICYWLLQNDVKVRRQLLGMPAVFWHSMSTVALALSNMFPDLKAACA